MLVCHSSPSVDLVNLQSYANVFRWSCYILFSLHKWLTSYSDLIKILKYNNVKLFLKQIEMVRKGLGILNYHQVFRHASSFSLSLNITFWWIIVFFTGSYIFLVKQLIYIVDILFWVPGVWWPGRSFGPAGVWVLCVRRYECHSRPCVWAPWESVLCKQPRNTR